MKMAVLFKVHDFLVSHGFCAGSEESLVDLGDPFPEYGLRFMDIDGLS